MEVMPSQRPPNAHTITSQSPDTTSQMDAGRLSACCVATRALFGMDEDHQPTAVLLVLSACCCCCCGKIRRHGAWVLHSRLPRLLCFRQQATGTKCHIPCPLSMVSPFAALSAYSNQCVLIPCSLFFGGKSNTPASPVRCQFQGFACVASVGIYMSPPLACFPPLRPTCVLCC